MTTLTAARNGLPAVAPGTRLLGEIITWSCSGASIRHLDLVRALSDSGLNEGVARELAPRHAFTRACRKLAQARIIRQVSEDTRAITFQFTAERRDGDRFEYELETLLTLDKHTGKVTCGLPGLATLAQEELDRAIEAGIEAITLSPMLGDFNDDLTARGLDALRAQIRVQIAPEDVSRFMALTP